jgi:hypothetical protein
MFVNVRMDETPAEMTLEEPADCTRFHVAVDGGARDAAHLDEVLRAAGAGRGDGDDARIAVDAVRRMAVGRVGRDWARDFDGMLAYARGKGWLDDTDGTIAAHVEWSS